MPKKRIRESRKLELLKNHDHLVLRRFARILDGLKLGTALHKGVVSPKLPPKVAEAIQVGHGNPVDDLLFSNELPPLTKDSLWFTKMDGYTIGFYRGPTAARRNYGSSSIANRSFILGDGSGRSLAAITRLYQYNSTPYALKQRRVRSLENEATTAIQEQVLSVLEEVKNYFRVPDEVMHDILPDVWFEVQAQLERRKLETTADIRRYAARSSWIKIRGKLKIRTDNRKRDRELKLKLRSSIPTESPRDPRLVKQQEIDYQDCLDVAHNSLSAEDFLLFRLFYSDHYSHEEIGHRLGIKKDASRQRLSRIMKKLRSRFS